MLIFKKLRETFWPIYGQENWKFVSMVLMLASALFAYTTVRVTKDALIVTAPGSDAGVLNFLKGYLIMPLSILFVLYYSIMSNKVSRKNLFYATVAPFLIFFLLFVSVLYPFSDCIHMDIARIHELQELYPRLKYIIPIFGYWSYSIFYVFAELWGNVSITLMFWQFANLNCTRDEVKKFYPLFGAYSNIGLMLAGYIQGKGISTELTCIITTCAILLMSFLYWWINRYILPQEIIDNRTESKKKPKLSLKESFKVILHSKYIAYIAIIVLAYGMTVNLAEVTWKAKIKELYPGKTDYQMFMGDFYFATGVTTMIAGLFLKNIISRFGLFTGAVLTPIVLVITSCGFFTFTLFSDLLFSSTVIASGWPLMLAVMIGAIQNISGKSTKYAVFDPTTQMTYVPLQKEDPDSATKAKAAVDVIGSRWGKSLGGHIQSFALLITGGSQLTIAPLLMCILIIIVMIWIFALRRLSDEYENKVELLRKEGRW